LTKINPAMGFAIHNKSNVNLQAQANEPATMTGGGSCMARLSRLAKLRGKSRRARARLIAQDHYFKVLSNLGLGITDQYTLSKRGTQIVAS
jgi:hypothetical protein